MNEEETVAELDAEALPEVAKGQAVSRRAFVTGALAGGMAGIAVAAGTGGVVWIIAGDDARAGLEAADAASRAALEAADGDARAALEASQAEARAATEAAEAAAQDAIEAERADGHKRVEDARAEAHAALDVALAENDRLRDLVGLYEGLEESGLDAILQAGMAALILPLEAVGAGARALRGGVSLVKESLRLLEEALPSAQQSLLWLEGRVSALAHSVQILETALGRALGKVTRNPIVEAVETFANRVLDYMPLRLGDKFRDAMAGLVTLVAGVDELIEGVNTVLLEPMRANWFAHGEGEGIGAALVDPMMEHLLDPLEGHLDGVDGLVDVWRRELLGPAERVLEDRAIARAQIVEYKAEHGLG